MAWSTREVAELAGTTVNAVRHYHRVGLLAEPERRHNGYKQYDVQHLVTLLRIRQLADMGLSLAQIAELDRDGDLDPEMMRQLDAALSAKVEQLGEMRSTIATIIRGDAPAHVPAGFESVASRLSEIDTSLLHVYGQLYDDDVLKDFRRMAEADTDLIGRELEALPPDADEAARRHLVERLVPALVQRLVDYPWMRDPVARLSTGKHSNRQTLADAMAVFYNAAQIDVLRRANTIAFRQLGLKVPELN
ncbi:transcriptional regulator, MerR family protein [Paractinoplanes abujensis]|uniref:DNA-binding transcriptional MerR regulator n=1 Tax=Paractinoplanes abujensis TaxID=882441 RepID=A0A7W7G2Q4_9ACTN|nr:MerR family transcriptional regulator [Actinoplanes abujensis]MBB4693400.1 DNA-binding transcriptional MerR regulator [Actinoplanes abujensis]GID24604.1 transcriptional regulator, MerR family protein [Actinoplanes abujensis]